MHRECRWIAMVLCVLMVAFLGACSGDGDKETPTDPSPAAAFTFNGTWSYAGTVVNSSNPAIPVGSRMVDMMTFTATDPNIRITIASVPGFAYTGTCNTPAGTYDAQGVYQNLLTMRQVGQKTGTTTMEGDESWTGGGRGIGIHWTMSKVQPVAVAANSATGASIAEILKRFP